MTSRIIASLVIGGILASASPAFSQARTASTPAEAREGRAAFEQAYAAFQSLDYAAALPLFQRAYQLTRNPAMLYNIGATLEALGRNAEAATAFRRYAAMIPNAPNRAESEARASRLEAVATQTAPNPSSAASEATNATLSASVPSSSPSVDASPRSRPIWPFVVLGVGAAIGIAGGVTLGLTPDPGRSNSASEVEYLRAADAASTQQWVGVALIGVGAAAAIAAVIGIALGPSSSPSSSRRASVRWSLSPSHDGAIVGIGWSGVGL